MTVSERTRWAIVVAFAIAMAWVEAASVFYIRALVDRDRAVPGRPAADTTAALGKSSCGARRPRW